MQEVDLLNNIGKIIVFLLVFFSFFLLTVKTQKKLPNRLFSIFLLLIAFDLSGLFLYEWFLKNLYLEILRISSSLLQMPLFYLYVLSVCYADFTLKSKHLFHTLLFIAFCFIFQNIPVLGDGILLFEIAGEIQYAFYIIAILLALKKYKKIYLENYTNADQSIEEIAKIINCNSNNVKIKLFRSRKKIASILRNQLEPEILAYYESERR